MQYIDRGGEIEIIGITDFDHIKTLECGQCFRWDADENSVYTGVAFGRAIRLRSCGNSFFLTCSPDDFEMIWRKYFDFDLDYTEICRSLAIDDFMRKAIDYGRGIRILRQERWEALCSFIISQCNNIPRIKKIISALCRNFGESFEFDGKEFHSFPSAVRLAALEPADLAPLRCGYRADYIIAAARAVASGSIDLDALARSNSVDARAVLKTLHGVGNKVADCVLLYGLHMPDAFPLDVWMKRAVAQYYGPAFDPKVFAPYAGIAQQYIFHYVRNGGQLQAVIQ